MPSKKTEELLDAEASAQADIDEHYEELQERAADRVDEILRDPGQRDPEIFELIGGSAEDPFESYFDVPLLERDLLWQGALSAMVVAARMQTWVELFGLNALALYQANGRKIDDIRKTMSQAEIREAALAGIGKARINGEKDRRRAAAANREG